MFYIFNRLAESFHNSAEGVLLYSVIDFFDRIPFQSFSMLSLFLFKLLLRRGGDNLCLLGFQIALYLGNLDTQIAGGFHYISIQEGQLDPESKIVSTLSYLPMAVLTWLNTAPSVPSAGGACVLHAKSVLAKAKEQYFSYNPFLVFDSFFGPGGDSIFI